MKLSTQLFVFTSIFSLSSARMIIGNFQVGPDQHVIAWNDGEDPCTKGAVLSKIPDNPCGIPFTITGFAGATLEGCGGELFIMANGIFQFNCQENNPFIPVAFCGNPGGGFGLDQVAPIRQTFVCG